MGWEDPDPAEVVPLLTGQDWDVLRSRYDPNLIGRPLARCLEVAESAGSSIARSSKLAMSTSTTAVNTRTSSRKRSRKFRTPLIAFTSLPPICQRMTWQICRMKSGLDTSDTSSFVRVSLDESGGRCLHLHLNSGTQFRRPLAIR